MLVYGDDEETGPPLAFLDRLSAAAARLDRDARGLGWHGAAVALFIDLAALAQGFADAEWQARGHDELSPAQDRLHAALRALALCIDRSWSSGFVDQTPPGETLLAGLRDLSWPAAITRRRCEGYAYYGLYPEAYLDAARGLPADCVAIGIRSIGTGLAALVAAAAGTRAILTVRPAGPPFARAVQAGPRLAAWVRAQASRCFVVADEGPGLSGSSFGGVADWLEGLGVAPERIVFMPSHSNDVGPEATPAHRQRWAAATKRVQEFEPLLAAPEARRPLRHWFADVTGRLVAPVEDLSGGRWAAGRPGIPLSPGREARKYRLHGERGRFLLKYAGLDRQSRGKLARAVRLHEAGLAPEPLGLRHGFLLERWVDGAPVAAVPEGHLLRYLAFRRRHFPARRGGASLAALLAMARRNIGEAVPEALPGLDDIWGERRAAALQPLVEPVHVDGRLHAWEWLQAEGWVAKCDALDHSEAHDLVGCQDIGWDFAGAAVEHPGSAGALAEAYAGRDPRRAELLALMRLCYLGFQIGWWSYSGTAQGEARGRFYRDEAAALLGGPR